MEQASRQTAAIGVEDPAGLDTQRLKPPQVTSWLAGVVFSMWRLLIIVIHPNHEN